MYSRDVTGTNGSFNGVPASDQVEPLSFVVNTPISVARYQVLIGSLASRTNAYTGTSGSRV